jgi:2-polyprenyl-6-methoxyphenol hydroxylase-like FAD-dependent oxidoreductase
LCFEAKEHGADKFFSAGTGEPQADLAFLFAERVQFSRPERDGSHGPQDVTERLLVEHLRRAGGAVEDETRFVAAAGQDHYVNVTMDRKDQPIKLRALFVVGCDGAHSAVRHLPNLPFEGAEYDGGS